MIQRATYRVKDATGAALRNGTVPVDAHAMQAAFDTEAAGLKVRAVRAARGITRPGPGGDLSILHGASALAALAMLATLLAAGIWA